MEEHQEGFDYIAEKMDALYQGQEGLYYGSILPGYAGGNEPLDGVEVWRSEKGIPHWHYVTYGLTELYEKESENLEESGWGFELTFRLKREEGEEQPPTWPISLLQNLARYVFSSGNVFGNGHHMSCNGPVMLESDTKLTALGFRIDKELGEMDTINGHMTFLQAIAITDDEMKGQMCWDGEKFLDALMEHIPLGITDLSRASMMDNTDFRAVWEKGVEKDGSSTGSLYVDELGSSLEDGQGYLRLGSGHTEIISIMLRARLGKERSFCIQGHEQWVVFQSSETDELKLDENKMLVIFLSKQTLEELCGLLKPHAGKYKLQGIPLTLELVPTYIKDRFGEVIETIE